MSFEQLMQHADDIARRAWNEAMSQGDPKEGPVYPKEWTDNLRRMCEEVPAQFEPFSKMPNPSDYDAAIDMLKPSLERLSSGHQQTTDPISTNGGIYKANHLLTKLSGAGSYLEGWMGTAAMEFKSNFIDPFPAVVSNQFILVAALKAALEAEKAMWEKAREDADKIAHDTLTAIANMGESGANAWTMTFTVVASIAAVAATVPTLGASSVITITAVGAASQVAAAAKREDPPKLQVSGEHADQVLRSMGDCLRRLQEEIDNTDRRIANAVMSIAGEVHGARDAFVSKRPALASATPANVKDLSQMGYSSD